MNYRMRGAPARKQKKGPPSRYEIYNELRRELGPWRAWWDAYFFNWGRERTKRLVEWGKEITEDQDRIIGYASETEGRTLGETELTDDLFREGSRAVYIALDGLLNHGYMKPVEKNLPGKHYQRTRKHYIPKVRTSAYIGLLTRMGVYREILQSYAESERQQRGRDTINI